MSKVRRVVTPVAWISVLVTIDEEIDAEALELTSSLIYIRKAEDEEALTRPSMREHVLIGKEELITLAPGRYQVRAFLGNVASENVTIEVHSGEVEKINFHFGTTKE